MKNFHLQKIAFAALVMFLAGSLLTSCSSIGDSNPPPTGTITIVVNTLAGGGVGNPATVTDPLYGRIGSANGNGTAASFNAPADVVIDQIGNLYVSEAGNHMIRRVTANGIVTTYVGNTTGGFVNGTGTTASFSSMQGIAIDASGNLYVADSGNQVIRKVAVGGIVTTFAGSGVAGADNGPAATASFNAPAGVALDAAGNVYVADFGNKMIRKISTTGIVSTLAGNGTTGYNNGVGAAASFTSPVRLVVDGNGNLYVSDLSLVRKIAPDGTVSTFAGNVPTSGYSTRVDGKGTAAGIVVADGIAMDAAGNIYLGDENVIRAITPDGTVTTIAGGGTGTTTDGPANKASFGILRGVAVNPAANLMYVTDYFTSLVRKISLQ